MKVALYARVSTQDKEQNPELQLAEMREFCQSTGWEIVQEYVDKASAADLAGRVAWTKMMKGASLRKFNAVLVWRIDRAFRSSLHGSSCLEILRSYNVGFKSLMESNIDTTTPMGEFVFHLIVAWSELERQTIIQRVNAGMDYARKHGTKSGKPIGRKAYDIDFADVCKALKDSKGSYSEAARILTKQYGKEVSAGFVAIRVKRSGVSKEEILKPLQTPAQKPDEN